MPDVCDPLSNEHLCWPLLSPPLPQNSSGHTCVPSALPFPVIDHRLIFLKCHVSYHFTFSEKKIHVELFLYFRIRIKRNWFVKLFYFLHFSHSFTDNKGLVFENGARWKFKDLDKNNNMVKLNIKYCLYILMEIVSNNNCGKRNTCSIQSFNQGLSSGTLYTQTALMSIRSADNPQIIHRWSFFCCRTWTGEK